ncbi:hypothetical protein HPP92_023377 [Vanilla planifolia]|nr:hypothetical protein HPP92_023377 [Vanilla planifolia]
MGGVLSCFSDQKTGMRTAAMHRKFGVQNDAAKEVGRESSRRWEKMRSIRGGGGCTDRGGCCAAGATEAKQL